MGRARRFWTDCTGASVAEYALLLLFIGVGLVFALNVLGGSISGSLGNSGLLIASASSSAPAAAGSAAARGKSGWAPGKTGAAPGLSGATPGQSGAAPPGKAGSAPGKSGSAPGQSK